MRINYLVHMSGIAYFATKEKKKGRAKGGFIIGKKKDWGGRKDKMIEIRGKWVNLSRIIGRKGRRDIIIVSIYNTENWEDMENKIKEIIEEHKREYIVIGGNFNARIGSENGYDEEGGSVGRISKDKVINNRGRKLLL